jgi:2-isopropylmalate synthase
MKTIQIYDTTLRDGSQGEGINFSLQDKLLITGRLAQIGFDYVEGGYPLSNKKDAQYFRKVRNMDLGNTKVCAFGMTHRRGILPQDDPGMRALLESQAEVITIVGKTSDFHVAEVLRASNQENLDMVADTVAYLRKEGREVIYDAEHFFDGWKSNAAYAAETIRTASQAGAAMVVLCDTNGGSMPEEISVITAAAGQTIEIPIGIHCHNDCALAVANSLAAVSSGATQVQGTINGFGERCGNADLISVIANLGIKQHGFGVLAKQGVERLTELSRFVYETANMRYQANQPFVGTSAFAHKGGMHVHAVQRVTASYEHIDPEKVGNERRFLVSELSGRSNIIAMTTKHNIQDDHQLMDRILALVVDLENQGYQFEAAEASFDLLVKRSVGTFKPHFERINYHVNVETDRSGQVTTEATVKLWVDNGIRHEVAEGDGPVNALDAALRKALKGTFPNLDTMRLVDYKVRVINSEAATAAAVRVIIQSEDDHGVWGSVGVSENVIEASWIALVDSIEYKLYKDEKAE